MSRYTRVLQVAVALLLLSSSGFAQVSDFAGSYFGLIGQPGETPIGSVQMVLNRGGHGSLAVRIEHAAAAALVSVTADGIVAASRATDRGLQVYLSVVPGTGAAWNVVGTVSEQGVAYPVTLVGSAGTAGGAEGTYTLALDTAPVDTTTAASLIGLVSANVSPSGNVRLIGSLADGTVILQGGYVNADGNVEWFVGAPRAASVGSFSVSFPTSAAGTVSGSGTLENGSGVKTVAISGSHFSAAAGFGASPAWELSAYNGTDVTPTVTVDGITSPAHRPNELRAGGAVPVSFALDGHTGLILGNYTAPSAGRPVRHYLAGAVFQDSNMSEGFLLQKTPGRFVLMASSSTTVSSTNSGASLTLNSNIPAYGGASSGLLKTGAGTLNLNGSSAGTLVLNGNLINSLGATNAGGLTNTSLLTLGNTPVIGNINPPNLTQTVNVNSGGLTLTNPGVPNYVPTLLNGGITGVVSLNNPTSFSSGLVSSGLNTLTIGNVAAAGHLITTAPVTIHLGAAFFSGFSPTMHAPTLTLWDGSTVILDAALPAGWSIAVNGQPQTAASFVVPGATGAGSNGVVTFVYTAPATTTPPTDGTVSGTL